MGGCRQKVLLMLSASPPRSQVTFVESGLVLPSLCFVLSGYSSLFPTDLPLPSQVQLEVTMEWKEKTLSYREHSAGRSKRAGHELRSKVRGEAQPGGTDRVTLQSQAGELQMRSGWQQRWCP